MNLKHGIQPSWIVYDIEIARAIPPGDGNFLPGVEYCQGWDDHEHMGVACVCAHLSEDGPRVYMRDNLADLPVDAHAHDLVVGFNSRMFDDRVLHCNGIEIRTDCDLIREVYRALGFDPYPDRDYHDLDDYKGRGLDALAKANGYGSKSGNGAHAPVWFQRGEYGRLIDYCMRDVTLTKALFVRHVIEGRPLIDPVTGRELILRTPGQILTPDRYVVHRDKQGYERGFEIDLGELAEVTGPGRSA